MTHVPFSLTVAFAAILFLVWPSVVVGQQALPCGPREKVLSHLLKKYGESVIARGKTTRGQMVEVLSSEDGSWTIIVSNTAGRACFVADGEDWRRVTPLIKPLGTST